MPNLEELSKELRHLLVQELHLKVSPEEIPIDAPLLDPRRPVGVAIDSLDMLSLVMVIEDRYGITLPENTKELKGVFESIRSLAENVVRLQPAAQGA